MKTVYIVLAVIGVAAALLATSRSILLVDRSGIRARVITPSSLMVRDIPALVEHLRIASKNGSWAAFAFTPPNETATDDSSVNLQYSVENGVVGLDWVLLGPRNKADKEKVVAFIKQRNHTVREKEGNGVRYLRVEDGNIEELGVQIAGELYHMGRDGDMALFADKFEWRPAS